MLELQQKPNFISKVERIKTMPTLIGPCVNYAHAHATYSQIDSNNTLNHKGTEDLNFVSNKVWFKIKRIRNL